MYLGAGEKGILLLYYLLLVVIGISVGWVQEHMNKIIHAQSTHIIDGDDKGPCSVVLQHIWN